MALHPTNSSQGHTNLFKMRHNDLDNNGKPKEGRENKYAKIFGIALTEEGRSFDPNRHYGPVLVKIKHPRGHEVVANYRLHQGRLEMELPSGWTKDIFFWSRKSGVVDLMEAFGAHFRVEYQDYPVIFTIKIG